jgi:hypothetical protein
MKPRFSIRDLAWLTVVIAVFAAWVADRSHLRHQVTVEGNTLKFVSAAILHDGYTVDDLRNMVKQGQATPDDYNQALEESKKAVEQYLQVIESLQKEAASDQRSSTL